MFITIFGFIFTIAYVWAEDIRGIRGPETIDLNMEANEISISNHPKLKLLPNNICGNYSPNKILLPILKPSDHPWTVLLRMRLANGRAFFTCGGTLISDRYVLTAAYCLKNYEMPPSAVIDQVRVGEYDLDTNIDCIDFECSPPAKNIEIEDRIIHSNFNLSDKTKQNNIALLRLKTPVKFRDEVQPVCLPLKDVEIKNDERPILWTVGWGITNNGQKSSEKREEHLRMIPFEKCSSKNYSVTESQICAKGPGVKMCQGDTGGPLMNVINDRWYIQGIFSNAPMRCRSTKSTGIYTKVYNFMGWILDNIRE